MNVSSSLLIGLAALGALLPPASGALLYDPALPTVSIEATEPQAAEPGGALGFHAGVFTLARTGSAAADLTVHYSISGSASNGVDYAALPDSVVIPAGQNVVQLYIEPLADLIPDGRETVRLTLTPFQPSLTLTNEPFPVPTYSISPNPIAMVSIADADGGPSNHPPVVTLVHPGEGEVLKSGPVFLSAQASDPDGDVVILRFFAGTNLLATATNRTSPIILLPTGTGKVVSPMAASAGDPFFSGDLAVQVMPVSLWPIWNATPGEHVLTVEATDEDGATTVSAPVHVTVVPPPTVTLQATTVNAWEPGPYSAAVPAVITVTRTGSTADDLAVSYVLSGSAKYEVDYAALSGFVTIPAGEASAQILITPLRDSLVERMESVTLKLSEWPLVAPTASSTSVSLLPWPLSPPYRIGRPAQATVYVRNDSHRNNRVPTVRLVSPIHGRSIPAGLAITLAAEVADSESYVTKVEFFDGTTRLGEVPCLPQPPLPGKRARFTFLWTDPPAGTHQLRARATDTDGAVQLSAVVRVRVTEPAGTNR